MAAGRFLRLDPTEAQRDLEVWEEERGDHSWAVHGPRHGGGRGVWPTPHFQKMHSRGVGP